MEDKKKRILDFAWKAFMTSGYSNVTMDDIAHGCGVGKATVYKLFPSKEDLLLCSITFFAAGIKENIDAVLENEAIPHAEKLERLMSPILASLSPVNAAALDDIQRNAPEAFVLIDKKRREMIFANITKIIEDGKNGGVFREDVSSTLVAHVIVGALTHLANPVFLAELDCTPAQMIRSAVEIVISGCRKN